MIRAHRIPMLLVALGLAACKTDETTPAAETTDGPTTGPDSDPSDDDDSDADSDPDDSDDSDPSASDPSTSNADSDDTSADDDTADPTGDSGDWPAPDAGQDVSVVAFDGEHMYWTSESDQHRDADIELDFPDAGEGYSAISLEVAVRCPDGGCDYWDRFASIAVVEDAGTIDEHLVEVARFMTPYRVDAAWSIDVSHLRPLLTGTRTLRLHLDTWVGPGSDNGDGWLVDARFDMTGGVASPRPVAVIPVYSRRAYVLGDPEQPIADAVPPKTIDVPPGIDSATLVSIITGHGQGNSENCAEFCQDNHGYLLGGATAVMETIWRNDCDDTPVVGQVGNWMQDRAGWCPGADVLPWSVDITDAATPGEPMSVEYAVSPYENTCRPGLDECTNCGLVVTCEYDGNNHTEPQVRMSTVLVAWVD